ncbi:MAG: hypothetical protein HC877_04810 [Thioploca sp.]|nr:hypothetical protein [Thioploca sp.]
MEEGEQYRRWQKTQDEASFFLGAVDEAKLIKFNAFRDVLASEFYPRD